MALKYTEDDIRSQNWDSIKYRVRPSGCEVTLHPEDVSSAIYGALLLTVINKSGSEFDIPYEDILDVTYTDATQAGPVNHPKHYTDHPSGVECIQITEHMNFNLGNAIKYVWRADLKHDAIEDLRKAVWYIERELKRREGTS